MVFLAPKGPQGVLLQRVTGASLGQRALQAALASLGLQEALAQRVPQGGLVLAENQESEDLEARRGSRESPDESLEARAQDFLGRKGTVDLQAFLDPVAHWGTQDPRGFQDSLERL